MRWVLRSFRRSTERTNTTSEPSISSRSSRRPDAQVTRTTAGDTRSTGKRETGTIKAGTPLITTVPYVYEAFSASLCDRWRTRSGGRSCGRSPSMPSGATGTWRLRRMLLAAAYTPAPDDPGGVINASAYRAFLLTKAGIDFSETEYRKVARRNLNFVLDSQNADGSWYYSTDGKRDFVDHFHTCFVLKALAKIEELTGSASARALSSAESVIT